MLQRARALLEERFGLVLKRETKELPAYALTVAKGGPKLNAAATQNMAQRSSSIRGNNGRLTWTVTTADPELITRSLSGVLERTVVDRTGLTGLYDFKIEWVQDLNATDAGPSVFTALQEQLGLKLEATKAPVEVYVIVKAEHPSEN